MPRPRKATVDFFPHYVNHGESLFNIEAEFGNDGYAFWFKLLEILGRSEHHFYDCNKPKKWMFLLSRTGFSEEKAIKILTLLAELESIDRDLWKNHIVWSANFVMNLDTLYSRREINPYTKEDIMGLCIQKPPVNGINVDINPQRKGKGMKGKENIYTQDEQQILDLWNSKDIVKHEPTLSMQKEISIALKKHGKDNIVIAINNYVTAYRDAKFYYSNRWRLDKFLKQSNGLPDFLEEGQRWINYIDSKGNNSKPASKKEAAWKEYDRDKKSITKREEILDNLCDDLEAKLNERST